MSAELLPYKLKFLRCICALAALSYCYNAKATSLNEALVSSYQTNPQIKSAIEALQSIDEEMPSAISGALPSASSSLQRGQISSTTNSIDTSGITDSKSIGISQPLFKGGRTYASIKKAKNDIMAAREQLKNTEQQILLAASVAYMDVVSNTEAYELAQNNKSVLAHHLEETKTRFDLGELTQTDVAQSKASLAKANSDLISTQRSLESSKAAYTKIIGQEPIDVTMPKNPIEINGSSDELINIALANNPVIKISEYNLNAAKDNVTIQKSSLLPQLSAFANKERQQGVSATTSRTSITDSDTFGINLSIPIYQAGSEYALVRQAKHVAGKNSYDLAVARNEIKEAVIKAYQDFRVAQALIESNQASVDAFSLALEGTQQEANAGLRTNIDVLDAEQALFDAKSNLIKSKRDEVVSSYTLLAQLGKLTAKELGLKVDVYNPEENYNKVKYQFIGF